MRDVRSPKTITTPPSRRTVWLARLPPHDITVTSEQWCYPDALKAAIRDLWRHQDLPPAQGALTATVQGHGIVMVTVKP